MRPDPVNRLRASALAASCALSCLACDALVGLDPTVLVTDLPLKDAATPAVGFEASPEAMTGMDAAPEGAPDAACTPCPTGCVDTNSDGDNCGACGHSCLGATCSGGACVAVILTTGAPADLAVDQTNVYWTDGTNGNVKRCPIAGCSDGGETLFVGSGANLGGAGLVAGIALQGSRVVFAENTAGMGEVYACPTDGCGTAPAPFARETGGQVGAVAADATNVYWTSTLDQSVHECPIDGCAGPYPTALAIGSVNALDPWGLVVRDGRFYFAYAQYGFGFSEGVGGCSIAGCTCTMGACVLPSPVRLGSGGHRARRRDVGHLLDEREHQRDHRQPDRYELPRGGEPAGPRHGPGEDRRRSGRKTSTSRPSNRRRSTGAPPAAAAASRPSPHRASAAWATSWSMRSASTPSRARRPTR